jgi:hypothetical protein
MNRETYEQAKKQLEEIDNHLREGNLTAEERQKFETLKTQLAGVLLHPWLPVGWGRRSIMIILLIIGIYGLAEGRNYLLLAWVLLLFFSPRFVGELFRVLGKVFESSH